MDRAETGMVPHRLTHLDIDLLEQLAGYGRESLGGAALDEWMLPVIATCGLLYVGKMGEEIVGSAQIIRCLEERDLYMDGFYVRPRFRRRGYGVQLLSGVQRLLAGEGFSRLLVTLAPENEAGLSMYAKCGFREVDFLPDFYGQGRSRLLLAADLAGSR